MLKRENSKAIKYLKNYVLVLENLRLQYYKLLIRRFAKFKFKAPKLKAIEFETLKKFNVLKFQKR